jgi:hypothetical protein
MDTARRIVLQTMTLHDLDSFSRYSSALTRGATLMPGAFSEDVPRDWLINFLDCVREELAKGNTDPAKILKKCMGKSLFETAAGEAIKHLGGCADEDCLEKCNREYNNAFFIECTILENNVIGQILCRWKAQVDLVGCLADCVDEY